jgi:hypothetical protein
MVGRAIRGGRASSARHRPASSSRSTTCSTASASRSSTRRCSSATAWAPPSGARWPRGS